MSSLIKFKRKHDNYNTNHRLRAVNSKLTTHGRDGWGIGFLRLTLYICRKAFPVANIKDFQRNYTHIREANYLDQVDSLAGVSGTLKQLTIVHLRTTKSEELDCKIGFLDTSRWMKFMPKSKRTAESAREGLLKIQMKL